MPMGELLVPAFLPKYQLSLDNKPLFPTSFFGLV